jgi:hypothetical protein
MTKAIWHIFPTERQLANPEWLRLNGWRKLSGDTGSAGGEGMSEQTRVQEFAEILGRPLTKSERLELLTSLAASERLDEARYQLNHVKACGTRAEALDWQGKRIAALERTAKGESQ